MENVLSCLIEWNICRCSQCSLWALLNSIPVVLSTTLPHHWTGVYVAEYSIETVCYKAKLQEQFVHEVFYAFSIHPVSCTILDSIWGYCKNCLRCCTVGLITWPHDCKVNFLSSWLCLCLPCKCMRVYTHQIYIDILVCKCAHIVLFIKRMHITNRCLLQGGMEIHLWSFFYYVWKLNFFPCILYISNISMKLLLCYTLTL